MNNKAEFILFYSIHPEDQLSKKIIDEINKNPLLDKTIKKICVSNPNLKLPEKLKTDLKEIPSIISRGFNKPISGIDALTLLQNSNKATGGLEFGDISNKEQSISDKYGALEIEAADTKSNFYDIIDKNYSKDHIEQSKHNINSKFSNLEDIHNMDIYEDKQPTGKNSEKKLEIDKKYDKFLKERDIGIKKPISSIIGNNLDILNPNMPMRDQHFSKINNKNENNIYRDTSKDLDVREKYNNYNQHMNKFFRDTQTNDRFQHVQPPINPLANIGFHNSFNNSSIKPSSKNIGLNNGGLNKNNGNYTELDSAFNGALMDNIEQFNTRKTTYNPTPGLPNGRGNIGYNNFSY